MARYKHYDYRQTKMLPVSFDRQILAGTFEYTLNELIDQQIDLSVFEERYKNDATGAPADDPAILLKIILFAYSRGITHSRQIEALCGENVVCMALSADTVPHFTTIASFVSSLSAEITTIFRNVLLVCDEAGLIGKEMFAVDGVKLPSNASREWSGTQAEYSKKIDKMQRAVEHLVGQHRYSDQQDEPAQWQARERQIQTLNKAIDKAPHAKPKKDLLFQPQHFQVAPDGSHCLCPAGERLYKSGRALNLRGFEAIKFKGTKRACATRIVRRFDRSRSSSAARELSRRRTALA